MAKNALKNLTILTRLASPKTSHAMREHHARISKMFNNLQHGLLGASHIKQYSPKYAKGMLIAHIVGGLGEGISRGLAMREDRKNREAKEKFRNELLARYSKDADAENAEEKRRYEEARKDKEKQHNWEREKFQMSQAMHQADRAQHSRDQAAARSNQFEIAKMKQSRPEKQSASEDDEYKSKSGGISRGEMIKIASQKFKNPEDVKDYVTSHGKARVKKESGSMLTKLPIIGKLAKMAGIKGNESYTIDRQLPKARR